MLKQAPKPSAEQLAEIAKLEERAEASRRAKQESFDRCDTDGFVSQWASGVNAERDYKQIEILKNGGHAEFRVLVDGEGNVVADHVFRFANKQAPWLTDSRWRLADDLVEKLGRKWVPTGDKSRIQKQLGLHEEKRWFPAYAKLTAPEGAKGLSGASQVYVGVFRADTDREG